MRKKIYGITIANTPIGDIDKKVFILGKEYYFCGIAKGAQKSKKRFGLSIEPFSISEFILYKKNSNSIPIIESATLLFFEKKILESHEYSLSFLILSEIITKTLKSGMQSELLFRLTNTILTVEKPPNKAINLILYFIFWFIKLEGIFEFQNVCSKCGRKLNNSLYISLETTEVVCNRCKTNTSLKAPEGFVEFVNMAKKTHPSNFLNMEIKNKKELLKFFIKLISNYAQVEFTSTKFIDQL